MMYTKKKNAIFQVFPAATSAQMRRGQTVYMIHSIARPPLTQYYTHIHMNAVIVFRSYIYMYIYILYTCTRTSVDREHRVRSLTS